MIRTALGRDVRYLADAMDKLATHVRAGSSHPYTAGLRSRAGRVQQVAQGFVADSTGFALIAEIDGQPVGCAAGRVAAPSVEWAGIPEVGHLSLVWVDPVHRRSGVARALTEAAEDLLRTRGVDLVELSFVVGNTEAEQTWRSLGYQPFRVFSSKRIGCR